MAKAPAEDLTVDWRRATTNTVVEPVEADRLRVGVHGHRAASKYSGVNGVRGKHHLAYKAGTNVVVLDPDVAKAFPDASSVNQALRLLLELAKKQLSKRSA